MTQAAEVAARRVDVILASGVPPERLALVPDCDSSQAARHLATAKLHALGAVRHVVRGSTSVTIPTS